MAATTPSKAIVATAPEANHVPGANWSLQDIQVPTDLKDGEILVEMVASGICHTDFMMTSVPASIGHVKYPRVAGHEGAGYIKALGPNITNKELKEGDPVLLSFASCAKCASCQAGRPNLCAMFAPLNYFGRHDTLRTAEGGDLAGLFFGHSSFAKLSIVGQNSVVPAASLVKDREELKLFSPLGCGLQTGAGAILNIAKPDASSSVMVAGLGGVGLGAIMAAKIAGCEEIIGVDRVASRIEVCKGLGATNAIDTSSVEDLTKTYKQAANGGNGPDVFIDTTGSQVVQAAAFAALANHGMLIFIGHSGNPADSLNVNLSRMMNGGIRLVGCIEGDSVPWEFIPQLIQYYRDGKFPIEKVTKFYKAEDFKSALHGMHSGDVIKAVLEW